MNGMMIGVRLDGMKVVVKLMTISASSFSLGSFDIGGMSCPKRFERVKMNP